MITSPFIKNKFKNSIARKRGVNMKKYKKGE